MRATRRENDKVSLEPELLTRGASTPPRGPVLFADDRRAANAAAPARSEKNSHYQRLMPIPDFSRNP
jgi:hypothetical protein